MRWKNRPVTFSARRRGQTITANVMDSHLFFSIGIVSSYTLGSYSVDGGTVNIVVLFGFEIRLVLHLRIPHSRLR